MFKKILLLIVLVVACFSLGKLITTWLSLKNLVIVEDPMNFALNFDPANEATAQLKVGGLEGRVIHSPYYPYKTLETKVIQNSYPHLQYDKNKEIDLSEKGVWINIDPFWNVFWVELKPEGQAYAPVQFYGPYKLSH
jgi:hypothetical protein